LGTRSIPGQSQDNHKKKVQISRRCNIQTLLAIRREEFNNSFNVTTCQALEPRNKGIFQWQTRVWYSRAITAHSTVLRQRGSNSKGSKDKETKKRHFHVKEGATADLESKESPCERCLSDSGKQKGIMILELLVRNCGCNFMIHSF